MDSRRTFPQCRSKQTKSKMDTDSINSNTEKGKRSLIHHVLKPSAKKNIFPDVGCKKINTNRMEIKIVLHTKSKTDTDSNTEKGKRSTAGFLIFSHTIKIAGMSDS